MHMQAVVNMPAVANSEVMHATVYGSVQYEINTCRRSDVAHLRGYNRGMATSAGMPLS
jgi:hypothetical protein